MATIRINKYEYAEAITLIEGYLNDVFVTEVGALDLPDAEDMFSDILTTLNIEQEK